MPPRKKKEPAIISVIKTIYDIASWIATLLGIAQGVQWLIETINRLFN